MDIGYLRVGEPPPRVNYSKSQVVMRSNDIGGLADTGVFGLSRYLRRRKYHKNVNTEDKFKLMKGLEILVELNQWFKDLNELNLLGVERDLVNYLKEKKLPISNKENREKYINIVSGLIEGQKYLRTKDIKEVKQELGNVSDYLLGSVLQAIEDADERQAYS